MFRRFSTLAVVTAFLFVPGCSDDSKPAETLCSSLPQAPQILPNAQAGVVPFDMLTSGDMQTLDIVFVNGGQDDLAVSDVRVEGDDFTLLSVTPDTRTVACAEALAVQVRFESPGPGVSLGRLVVESNAGNFSSLEIELVGPTAGSANAPEIAAFETEVNVEEIPGVTVPAALIRYYNIGAETLVVDSYTVDDPTSFRFLSGTQVPGAACEADGVCEPEAGQAQGCCGTPQLACVSNSCAPIRVVSGDFVLFGVRFTEAATGTNLSTPVTIHSEDSRVQDAAVTVTGTP
jgi:hypothetical protein